MQHENTNPRAILGEEDNRALMGCVLLVLTIFFVGYIAGTGAVKTPVVVTMTFYEATGENPIDSAYLEMNYTDIVFSKLPVKFLDRFDSQETNSWVYAEQGNDIANTGMAYTASRAIFTVVGDGDTNNTYNYLNHTATETNRLKPDGGVIIHARINESTGTPTAFFGLQNTNKTWYVKAGFDGSGNIDLVYYSSTYSATTVQILTSATADHWYFVEIELYGSNAIVKIFNETGTQKGDTQTVSTALTYAAFSSVFFAVNSLESTAEEARLDCVYSTTRNDVIEIRPQMDMAANNETAGAPDDYSATNIEFDYTSTNIKNDSASAEARTAYDYTYNAADFTSTRSFNQSQLNQALGSVSEIDNDISITQSYNSEGWTDLQSDTEKDLKTNIEDALGGISVDIVDYVVTAADLITRYSDAFQKEVQDFYANEAVELIIENDPDAVIELDNGETVTASKMPRELLAAFITGQSVENLYGPAAAFSLSKYLGKSGSGIKKITHSTAAKAKAVRELVAQRARKRVSSGTGVIQKSTRNVVSASTHTLKTNTGKVKKIGRSYTTAPTNFVLAKLKAGETKIRNTLGGLQSQIISGGKFVKDKALSAFAFAGDIAKTVWKYVIIGGLLALIVGGIGLFVFYRNKPGGISFRT